MAEYGIGRVPADVDYISESLAILEAVKLQHTTVTPAYRTGHCFRCKAPADARDSLGRFACCDHDDEE